MIAYLDASVLVKRYLTEAESSVAHALSRSRRTFFSSRLSQVEVASAIARARRVQRLSDEKHDSAQRALLDDLGSIELIEVRARLVTRAAELTQTRRLRGYDAIHLASAIAIAQRVRNLEFWTTDEQLAKAATAESLRVPAVWK